MSEFSKFNGYSVKDAYAREELEKLKNSTGGSDIVISRDEPTGENRKPIWIRKSKNLVDWKSKLQGVWYSDSGEIGYSNRYAVFNIFPILPNTVYTFSDSTKPGQIVTYYLHIFDKNKKHIGKQKIKGEADAWGTHNFTVTNSNARYARLQAYNFTDSYITQYLKETHKPQIEIGISANDYEEYIEPEIFILFSGAYIAYKDIVKNNYEYGLTIDSEIPTNEFLNNKRIYKRMIKFTGLTIGSNSKTIFDGEEDGNWNIANKTNYAEEIWISKEDSFAKFLNLNGTVGNKNDYCRYGFGNEVLGTSIDAFVSGTNGLVINITMNESNHSAIGDVFITVKYTKVNE